MEIHFENGQIQLDRNTIVNITNLPSASCQCPPRASSSRMASTPTASHTIGTTTVLTLSLHPAGLLIDDVADTVVYYLGQRYL